MQSCELMRFYQGDGRQYLWQIPFPFTDPASVGVSLVTADGGQSRLTLGRDYGISEGRVNMFLPAGQGLLIFLDAEPAQVARLLQTETARAGESAQASALTEESAPASPVRTASQTAASQAVSAAPVYEPDASLNTVGARLVDELREEAQSLAAKSQTDIASAGKAALANLAREAESQRRRIERALGLCGSPLPACAVLNEASADAGELLPLPVAYLAGSNTLTVYLNGLLLAPGLDYEETGRDGELSEQIRVLRPALAGDVWQVRVASLGSSENARRASVEARDWQRQSASLAQSAQRDSQAARTYASEAAASSQNVAGYADAAQKAAKQAYYGACRAWEAWCQASIHAARPGVSAVRKLEEIACASPGLFIVNEHLTHTPTPFMGVWPAKCVDDMAWDGIFFIGPAYPDEPCLPPALPPRPQPPAIATGDGDDWLPCGHNHDCASCPTPCRMRRH